MTSVCLHRDYVQKLFTCHTVHTAMLYYPYLGLNALLSDCPSYVLIYVIFLCLGMNITKAEIIEFISYSCHYWKSAVAVIYAETNITFDSINLTFVCVLMEAFLEKSMH